MKRFTLSFIFAFTLLSVFAQSKKYPTLIHFTNSNCGNCGASNPGFYSKINVYAKDIHHISVHPSFPYSNCKLYQANITDNTALTTKFGAGSTPTVSINGASPVGVGSVTDASLKTLIAGTSPIQVKVNENKGAARTVKVTVKSTQAVPAANYVIYAAVVEKVVDYKGTNSETQHFDVMRKLLTTTNGDNFTPAAVGKETVVNFTYNVDAAWKEAQTYTLVWIQNGNKEILNSGTGADVTVGTEDVLEDAIFSVFPNPAKNELKVDLSTIKAQPSEILIYNLEGKNVAKFAATNDVNTLNISELAQGEYILNVKTNNGVLVKKFLKY